MIRIIVIDDDRFICNSLKTILQAEPGIEVAAVGSSGEEAVELYESLRPDVLLMDIRMGGIDGLEAGERIIGSHPGARVLFLTTFSDDDYIVKAPRMGAKGYLIKQDAEALAPAIKAVMSGQSVFGGEVTSKIPSFICHKEPPDLSRYGIGAREAEVVGLVAKGLNNKEIGDELRLSEGTVRNYVSSILEKAGLRDRTQIAVLYYRR